MKHRLHVNHNLYKMATFNNGSSIEERVIINSIVYPTLPSGKTSWSNINEVLLSKKIMTIPESYDFNAV